MFEQALEDELSYFNPRAKEYDINSVRSIYVIRANKSAPSIEKTPSVLVTTNGAFAKAAWEYGQQHEPSKDVSSVITDFTLANIAWLKAPMGATSVPVTQLLAFSYAALQPSGKLLDKYLKEIDRLESQGSITESDHQLLRISPLVHGELMSLTLGEDDALTEETVTETLERVSREMRKEEEEKLVKEREAHVETRDILRAEQTEKSKIIENLYWRCYGKARTLSWTISGSVVVLLFIGFLSGHGLRTNAPLVSWILTGGAASLALLSLANLLVGYTLTHLSRRLHNRCLIWYLRREAKAIGVELEDISPGAATG